MSAAGGAPSQWIRPIRAFARVLSTSHIGGHVPLAYNLYEPADTTSAAPTGSLIFMHGLFGSKTNNRSISKYDYHADIEISPLAHYKAP